MVLRKIIIIAEKISADLVADKNLKTQVSSPHFVLVKRTLGYHSLKNHIGFGSLLRILQCCGFSHILVNMPVRSPFF
jgi:hypothetical protein